MWRFILLENIQRYRELLGQAPSNVEQARLQDLLREAEADLADLERLSTPAPVRQNEDLREVVERSVDDAVETLGALGACLQVWWPANRSLLLVAQKNLPGAFLRAVSHSEIDQDVVSLAAFARDTQMVLEDAEAIGPGEQYRATLRSANIRSALASPVHAPTGALVGVMTAYFVLPKHFDQELLEKAAGLARRTGVALGMLDRGNH
jgi:hypothetical protein